jgi:N-acyl-D-aspartate/D-glutamate deacylase
MSQILNRRAFLRESSTAALGLGLLPRSIWSRPSFDLVVRGGILRYPTADSRVRQGVTTEITGNCGGSAAPREPSQGEETLGDPDGGSERLRSWTDVASYFQVLEGEGISVNHALLVGQGTIRQSVAGSEDRPLTATEMGRVLSLTESAMDQGAFGLSTGLEYVPGRFTPTEEIVAMARIVARRGGVYASHVRMGRSQGFWVTTAGTEGSSIYLRRSRK